MFDEHGSCEADGNNENQNMRIELQGSRRLSGTVGLRALRRF